MFWPCETRTSICRNLATISSGLYRFLAITVLLDVKDIPQVGPLQWGWIMTVYCRDNKRVCPLPKAWQQLWEMLPEKRRTVDAWEPAIPLIGAAWHDATAMLKMVRLAEHLQWAAKHSALSEVAAFLRGLREDEWHHLGE